MSLPPSFFLLADGESGRPRRDADGEAGMGVSRASTYSSSSGSANRSGFSLCMLFAKRRFSFSAKERMCAYDTVWPVVGTT